MFDIEEIESNTASMQEYSVMDGMDVYTVLHEGGADYMAYSEDGKAMNDEFGRRLIEAVHEYRIK